MNQPTRSLSRARALSTRLPDIQDRAYAALLGAAVGDALGAAVEFMTPAEIRARHGLLRDMVGGGWLRLAPGQVTDDTEMSLCIARSIAVRGWSVEDIARRFALWLRSRPIDIGNTCRRGICRYLTLGTLAAPPNEGDAGNGAVMRMAPVALASLGDAALLEQWAIEQAHLTHHHALSDAACIMVGRLVQLACVGHSYRRLRQEAEATVRSFPALAFAPYRGLATAYVVDTMQTVLHCFFSTRGFERCLVATVNRGGDADTTGAIVGAIAGAFYGPDQIPQRWVRKLDPALVRELRQLSHELVARSPVSRRASIP